MKKNVKIITVVLSCLLLIGAVIGISVSAAEDTNVAIAKKSLSYEGAVRILYAIDAENVNAGDKVKMLFSYEEITAPTGILNESDYAYVNSVEGYEEINGKTYPIICSKGFAPVEMTKPVYAMPVVVDAANAIVATGASEKFSIFEYCTTRFSASPTADQFELYTNLLKFGAAAQEVLLDTRS